MLGNLDRISGPGLSHQEALDASLSRTSPHLPAGLLCPWVLPAAAKWTHCTGDSNSSAPCLPAPLRVPHAPGALSPADPAGSPSFVSEKQKHGGFVCLPAGSQLAGSSARTGQVLGKGIPAVSLWGGHAVLEKELAALRPCCAGELSVTSSRGRSRPHSWPLHTPQPVPGFCLRPTELP